MNTRYILVYDFETKGLPNPHTCYPVQLAAKVLHPRTLEEVQNGTFSSFIRPERSNDSVEEESVKWHAEKRGISTAEVWDLWNSGGDEKQVWSDFEKFTQRFHMTTSKKPSAFTAPIRAGANIIGYDNIIWDRLCNKYGMVDKNGRQTLAFARDNLDIQPMLYWWFENYDDAPENINMDTLRQYFGIKGSTGHDAFSDVNDCILIIRAYMKLFRRSTQTLQNGFRGAFSR